MPNQLPRTHRALRQETQGEDPTVQIQPTPQVTPGSVVVRILFANVLTYMREIYNGTLKYPYPTPLTIGTAAVGRVADVGPDATLLSEGQLVLVDDLLRGRDDPTAICLNAFHEGFTANSRSLMRGEWRDGTFAEYVKMPLENCHVLNEERLLHTSQRDNLGYAVESMAMIPKLVIPYAGLRSVNFRCGETVVVAPATGMFGLAAVQVALGLGAGQVIAMGRNEATLNKIKTMNPSRLTTIKITGDLNTELVQLQKCAPIDVLFDMTPHTVEEATYFDACILALRRCGRICIMGGRFASISIPYSKIMHDNITLQGNFMHDREHVGEVIRLVEQGLLDLGGGIEGVERGTQGLGNQCVGTFGLEQWEEAFRLAKESSSNGYVLIHPDT